MGRPIDPQRLRALTEREEDTFYERNPRSLALHARASHSLAGGVPSGVCALDPFPLAVARGEGAYVWSVDGHRYADYHNGFGTTVFGHGNSKLAAVVAERYSRGSHFGAMTEDACVWAEHLCDRFGFDWIRASASGTEATMDAIRLARAATGRTLVAKIEGGYHGTHDVALISNNLPLDRSLQGPDRSPWPRSASAGLSPRVLDEVVPLPFNDLAAAERALEQREVACLLIEPILMNCGTIWPKPGYLEGLRELCTLTGTLLIFDETKTGATVAWGGAEELFDVRPDMKTLGKGVGGGLPCGVIGDCTGAFRNLVENWDVPLLGTFSGNPLMAAAGHAALTQVLTRDAYVGLRHHHETLTALLNETIDRYELPAYVIGAAAKGCVVWVDGEPLTDYRDYQDRFDFKLGRFTWLYLVNRGIFLAPGQDEQHTVSIEHGDVEAALYADTFAELAAELRA